MTLVIVVAGIVLEIMFPTLAIGFTIALEPFTN